jgi:hypothetical protein
VDRIESDLADLKKSAAAALPALPPAASAAAGSPTTAPPPPPPPPPPSDAPAEEGAPQEEGEENPPEPPLEGADAASQMAGGAGAAPRGATPGVNGGEGGEGGDGGEGGEGGEESADSVDASGDTPAPAPAPTPSAEDGSSTSGSDAPGPATAAAAAPGAAPEPADTAAAGADGGLGVDGGSVTAAVQPAEPYYDPVAAPAASAGEDWRAFVARPEGEPPAAECRCVPGASWLSPSLLALTCYARVMSRGPPGGRAARGGVKVCALRSASRSRLSPFALALQAQARCSRSRSSLSPTLASGGDCRCVPSLSRPALACHARLSRSHLALSRESAVPAPAAECPARDPSRSRFSLAPADLSINPLRPAPSTLPFVRWLSVERERL